MKTHINPVKLNHWCPDIPDTYIKCVWGKGTLYHCVWECPKLNKYWEEVIENISKVVGVKVPHQAKLCILRIYSDKLTVSSKRSTLIDFGSIPSFTQSAIFAAPTAG